MTINHPTEEDRDALDFTQDVWTSNVKFALFNEETGESGNLHLQGYLELIQPRRLAWVKERLPRAHLEIRRGKREDAVAYCLKEIPSSVTNIKDCTGLTLFGFEGSLENLRTLGCNGGSTPMGERLSAIQKMIQEGKTEEDIADFDFEVWCKYFRALERYRVLKTKPRKHPVYVHVVQGPTGTGKSRWALEQYPDAYWKQRSQWWDGYAGHETVIIDEFYGWLPFDLLLRICDRYPLLVESKGGQIQFVAKRVVITTNALPESWYKTSVYFKSFIRRVSNWHVFPKLDVHMEFTKYEEAKEHFFQ